MGNIWRLHLYIYSLAESVISKNIITNVRCNINYTFENGENFIHICKIAFIVYKCKVYSTLIY